MDQHLIDRFFKSVSKIGHCWRWTGAKEPNGYGRFNIKDTVVSTHRFSYELHFGSLPTGNMNIQVLHRCNNKLCVNPDHLFIGTALDNYLHAKETGIIPDKDQRFNRAATKDRAMPKGICYDSNRGKFKCNIRVGKVRYQCRKASLPDAIAWRKHMEDTYWNSTIQQTKENTSES